VGKTLLCPRRGADAIVFKLTFSRRMPDEMPTDPPRESPAVAAATVAAASAAKVSPVTDMPEAMTGVSSPSSAPELSRLRVAVATGAAEAGFWRNSAASSSSSSSPPPFLPPPFLGRLGLARTIKRWARAGVGVGVGGASSIADADGGRLLWMLLVVVWG
jgi:hypothetical protein